MTFLQAITQAFVKKPLHLTGRASRAEFWYVFLLLFLIDLTVIFIVIADIVYIDEFWSYLTWANTGFMFALTVRRLHDVGRSGLLVIIPVIPIMIELVVGVGYEYGFIYQIVDDDLGSIILTPLNIIAWVVSFYIFFLTLCEGNRGPNKYGPDPYERLRAFTEQNSNNKNNRHFDFELAQELFDQEQLRAANKFHGYSSYVANNK